MSQNSGTRFFRHYKNKPYKYLGTARHSETLEELALYESLYENPLGRIWVRPKEMFFENVEIEGVVKPRFEKVDFRFQASETITETDIENVRLVYLRCFSKELRVDRFSAKIAAHSKFLFLYAFDCDQLVAFKFGYAENIDVFYSWSGGVLPEFQNLGLASELMKQQHEWCRKMGFKKILTRTRNDYIAMLRLNFNFGFKIIGTQKSAADEIKIILEKVL